MKDEHIEQIDIWKNGVPSEAWKMLINDIENPPNPPQRVVDNLKNFLEEQKSFTNGSN